MSNAVAKTVDQLPLAPAPSESAAILSVIERMAVNPDIDPDRIEKFIQLKERMDRTVAEKAFNAAMAAAQTDMSVVAVNATNTQTRSRYATYDQLDRALRPIYTKHGFALSFDEADSPKDEHVRIVCIVSHIDGFSRNYHRDMPADGKGAKGGDVMTKTHAAGAAASYGMRYLLRGIFNVAVGEEDRDGNAPKAAPKITDAQVKALRDLIGKAGTTVEKFCEVGKIEALPDLPAADFDRAVSWLNDRIKARAAKASAVDPKEQFDRMESGK